MERREEGESRFLVPQNISQQLDTLIDVQKRLGREVNTLSSTEQPHVMEQQDKIIQNCVLLGRKIDPTLALALTIQKKLWNLDMAAMLFQVDPWCQSSELDYSFEQYASRRTGRDPITLLNWTYTAEIWLIDNHKQEDISLIDPKTGQVLLEQIDGETRPVVKKWDPFFPDFTKLLLMNKTAKEGKIDEIGYGLLMNPDTRWTDIRDYVHGLLPWERKPIEEDRSISYFLKSGGELWAKKGELSEIIGTLDIDSNSFLVREGVAKIIRTFGVGIIV